MALKHMLKKDNLVMIGQGLLRTGTHIKVKSTLHVKDFMRSQLQILTPEDTLAKAADIIISNKIDGVPIVDDEGNLVGLVTKTLILRELLNGKDFQTPVGEFMIENVIATDPEQDVSTLITVNIGNLPVVKDNKVQGIVTLSDTIRAYFSSLIALREELNTIIDSTHNGILTVNEEGNVILVNRSAEEFLGLRREDVVGRPVNEVLPGNHLMQVMETGQGRFGQKFVFNNRVFIANETPVISNQEILGAVTVFQDISELELISEELSYTKQIKEELDAIIESSFDGIHVTDGSGKTLRVNKAFTRITGTSREELMGKTVDELVKEGVYAQPVTAMVLERREPVTFSQRSKPGNNIIITANPVFDEEGNIFRIVTNLRDITELNQLKLQLEQAQNLSEHYREKLDKYNLADKYVIRSQKSRDLVDLCIRLGQVDATVLIQGESGVGKEITAQIIHSSSSRRDKPMVSINCAAIPESLLESELFGYAPGAFTGASKNGKPGIFETANGGTLFLDEVGELPLNLQGKLLRAIQEKEITRVGSNTPISVDVRLIAATNRDLREMVERKEFRKDLYFRLNVVPVYVPPLRERKAEIPFFVAHFLSKFNAKYGLNKHIDERAIKEMMNYDWPGNVRELENFIERIVVTYPGDVIRSINLRDMNNSVNENYYIDRFAGYKLKTAVEQLEKYLIQSSLETFGSTRKAALELGVSQPTIVRKASKYGIPLRDV